ncbi:hypothetical protein QZH41_013619, partial [Actinostola sp. cb2023]
MALACLVAVLALYIHIIPNTNAALTTKTANAAFKKIIVAQKTCGSPSEKYYYVSQTETRPRLRQPSICDSSNSTFAHNASYLVDGDFNTFWQSTAMVNRANITIDLTGPMHKYYYIDGIQIYFQEFYRPVQMAFYRSMDNGASYRPWHYYVSSQNTDATPTSQCADQFQKNLGTKPAFVNDVICQTYPNITAKAQNDIVSWNPSFLRGEDINPSQALVDWINVTNIRIDFMTLNKPFDPLAVLWYHYAVKEVQVHAYCPCNGHGIGCQYNATVGDNLCKCQLGTCGYICDTCCPAYNQYPWKQGNKGPLVVDESSACQLCNCHNHSSVCIYNQTVADKKASLTTDGKYSGGGVCQDCQHNTEGVNCEKCMPFFYRPANRSRYIANVCEGCGCSVSGSRNSSHSGVLFLDCLREPGAIQLPGDCYCKNNTMNRRCDKCKPGYYNITASNPEGCQVCLCDEAGSVNRSNICVPDDNGQCPCKLNVHGVRCDTCNDTYYGLSQRDVRGCKGCLCNYGGSSGPVCNKKSGQCPCLKNITGLQCERPKDEAYYPDLHFMSSEHTSKGEKVVALPREFYEPTVLREDMSDFLSNCSVLSNDVKNGTSEEQFCKKAVFTLTTAYLGKALECKCSPIGSYNLVCAKYGGQCACKPGVTGRQCDQCLPGFYNFTSAGCTACGCTTDHKVCNSVTGQCECPPNTIGRVCDNCNATFWGWNSTTGCKACNCDKTGSRDLQCNLTNGICSCEPGVHLDKCTECQDEFKNFSSLGCTGCGCETSGSLNPVCSKTTGQCPCKNNSMSMTCNQCRPGSFYLYQPNPKGCTDCICMGITSNCTSTARYAYQRPLESSLWELYDEDAKKSIPVQKSVMASERGNIVFITANVSSTAQKLIWKANNNLTQKSLVSSYGGNLSFAAHVTNLSTASAVNNPKVTIKGSHGITIEHSFTAVALDHVTTRVVFMKETSWVYAGTLTIVSRAHFMLVLAKPLAVHVTASLLSGGDGYYKTSFGGVNVADVQDSPSVQGRALDVEHCSCGPEYTGLSCERCASSHQRLNVTDDSFFGKCTRCNCHSHTLDCYAINGQCYNCNHNTTGDHCERCLDSFYGNATDGTSSDCKTCPCEAPRTTTSLCTDFYGQPKCLNCSVGYKARLCDKCQLKYFGEPHLAGGNCTLCRCNSNSEICDTITGECKDCKYNSTGFNCERCQNETYGYAPRQNCTDCKCNPTGSKHNVCDHRTGQCACQANVDTRNCSRCMCKIRALGDKCDRCETNYYGLPYAPCKACDCNATGSNMSVPCNGVTGQCHCMPGVTGRQCDRCMVMHVNFSSDGCSPCPECARLGLQGTLNTTQRNLELSLNKSKQVEKLKPFKESLNQVYDRITVTEGLVKEFDNRIKDLQEGLNDLKSNTLNGSIFDLKAKLSTISTYANKLKENTTRALDRVLGIKNKTEDALNFVKDVNKFTSNIERELQALKVSAAEMLSKANSSLRHTYIDETTKVDAELARARYLKDSLVVFARYNVTLHETRAESLNASITSEQESYRNKLAEFVLLSKRNEFVTGINQEVNLLVKQTLDFISQGNRTLAAARVSLQHATTSLGSAWLDTNTGRSDYEEAEKVMNSNAGLKAKLTSLNTSVPQTQDLIRSTNISVNINATKHAANLTAEAKLRKSYLDSVQDNAKRAVAAIKQYESVVKLVNQSLETSVKVNESLNEIMKLLNNFSLTFSVMEKGAEDSLKKSESLLNITRSREIDVSGLERSVSTANQTFLKATYIGKQIDHYHNILLSKTNKLIEWSEPQAQQHSIIKDTIKAESYTADVERRSGSIWTNAETVLQEVTRLSTSMASINTSAEHARQLMPTALLAVSRADTMLQNVTTSVNQAQIEKNKTADLRSQLTSNMARLKEKLRRAKDKIAKIQHALKLQGNTSLEYTPTGRIAQKTPFSDISMDLKADRIQGPLLYLAERLSDPDNQISISLGLVYGEFVKFTYNLGSGPISVINYAVPVRAGKWYRVYASRFQNKARLTVTDYFTNYSRTYESSSNLIIPHMDTNFTSESPMFVGSLPDRVMTNETRRYFYGCIDNVIINQQPLDLWRPAKVVGNRYACSKCLDSAKPGFYDVISGTSFYGNPNTYVIQAMGTFDISQNSQMVFQFRTFQKSASIVNVQGDQAYLYGVYIDSGRLAFYFKNGTKIHTLLSNKTSYGNGRWYEVHVTRGLINSTLTIKDVGSGEMDIVSLVLNSTLTLPPGRNLVFGGRNPKSAFITPVSSQFAGALRNVSLSTTSGNLVPRPLNEKSLLEGSEQIDSCGILRRVERCIRFRGNSFAAISTGVRNITKLSIKFKTLNPGGVLVFGADSSVNYFFYLALFHGNLYLVHTNTPKTAEPSSTSGETLNDGAYHTVNIEVSEGRLKLQLDSRSTPTFNTASPGPIRLNGTLNIGALPSPSNVPFDIPAIQGFVGGMEYVKVNQRTQNIFSGSAKQVSLAGCSPARIVFPTAKPTIPPPTQPPPTCGDRYPELSRSTEPDQVKLGPELTYVGFNLKREVFNYMQHQHVITVNFRSLSPNGVLLYAADDMQSPTQFISVELLNGRIIFKFNTGRGLVRVQSYHNTYSNGTWYKALLLRIDQFGGLLVPKTRDYHNNRLEKSNQSLILNSPLYFGGVPKGTNTSLLEAVYKNGEAINFYGCMGSLEISSANEAQAQKLNPRKDFDPKFTSIRNASCWKNAQSQASFNGRSYILLYENYRLPDVIDMTLSFRTYIRSGLLIVLTNSTGRGAITLEQLQGQMILSFTSETNQTIMRWTDPTYRTQGMYNASFKMCDNKFHKVRVQRERSSATVTMTVDTHPTESFKVEENFSLNGNFYLGGVP